MKIDLAGFNDPDDFYQDVYENYCLHLNPYLARLMGFAGFGVEMAAEGCVITDHEGREFIDCLGGYGVFTFGHRNPIIVQAVKDQLDKMALSAKAFFSANAANLAKELARITPEGLEFSFFVSSGTEAVEAALKFAKASTKRSKIVSTEGSYHGKTIGALSTTGREKYRKPFAPLMPGVSFVPFGDFEAATAAVDSETAAFIVEPVQGEGGIHVAPDGYLTHLRKLCDKNGALLIVDEVQTGLGRTGRTFAVEHEGVRPDLLTLAKALGGGIMPLGVVIGTEEIWDNVFSENPLAHTSTFGGNPLACAAGLAALQVLESQGLAERSRILGDLLIDQLQKVAKAHPTLIREVRGRGLMVGIEMAEDEVGELVVAQLMKRGVCVAYALNNPRVLRFEPPLTISEEQIKTVTVAVEEAMAETGELLSSFVS